MPHVLIELPCASRRTQQDDPTLLSREVWKHEGPAKAQGLHPVVELYSHKSKACKRLTKFWQSSAPLRDNTLDGIYLIRVNLLDHGPKPVALLTPRIVLGVPLFVAAGTGARWAFNALHRTIKNNQIPGPNDQTVDKFTSPKQRAEYYQKNGAFFQDVGLSKPQIGQISYGISGLFGIDDQLELLSRYGINDDTQRTRLERAVGARDLNNLWYSPLRDNWPTPLERGFIDVVGAFGAGDGDGKADPNALLKWSWDRRHLLTTISGGRQILGGPIIGDPTAPQNYPNYVTLSMLELNAGHRDQPVDAAAALLAASGDNGATPQPFELFNAYARALMPHIDELSLDPTNWSQPTGSSYWTTVYGRSPELAILLHRHASP
jgi:hypothetical protein